MTRMVHSSVFGLAVYLALISTPAPVLADDPTTECLAVVGTFLTRNRFTDQQGREHTARSLISLTEGGHAFRNDSDQDLSENGFTFGDGRGAWRCDGQEGSVVNITVRILNFIYPQANQNQALIGRTDYAGTFDSESNVLRLGATLGFVPLDADPLLGDPPADAINVEVVGLKVTAP